MAHSNRPASNEVPHDLSLYDAPEIILLDDNHWLYIQKRYHMSPRELQIARLVCKGINNKKLATELRITDGTVKTHLRNIYRRVRVKNKIAMLLRFVNDANVLASGSGIAPPKIPSITAHMHQPTQNPRRG